MVSADSTQLPHGNTVSLSEANLSYAKHFSFVKGNPGGTRIAFALLFVLLFGYCSLSGKHLPVLATKPHSVNRRTTTSSSFQVRSSIHEKIESTNEHDRWGAYFLAQLRYERRINDEGLQPSVSNLRELDHDILYGQSTRNGGESRVVDKNYNLNMIRIPKAGSSHLSITGRALGGCEPEGYPCCVMQENLFHENVCPREGLFCREVRGCLDHYPKYESDEPTITQLRNVARRTVSAFFYGEVHNSLGCPEVDEKKTNQQPVTSQDLWPCFERYVQHPKYSNIMTKMLNGYYPYTDINDLGDGHDGITSYHVEVAKKRLCTFAWYSFVEMPLASKMLLYETEPFRRLLPNPVIFDLPASAPRGNRKEAFVSSTIAAAMAKYALSEEQVGFDKPSLKEINETNRNEAFSVHQGAKNAATDRKNDDVSYHRFMTEGPYTDEKGARGENLVRRYNLADYEVYDFALGLFCAKLRASGLLYELDEEIDALHHHKKNMGEAVRHGRTLSLFRYEHHFQLCREDKWRRTDVNSFCPL